MHGSEKYISTFLLIFLLPFTLPIILPLFIYKSIVVLSSKFQKDLVRPVKGLDVAFCTDDFWTRPKGAISFIWICEGQLDPSQIFLRFSKALDTDSYYYEKLKSVYPAFWMGVPFWKKAEDFNLKNHFSVLSSLVLDFKEQSELNKILVEWMRKGFKRGFPLWEVFVIPEFIMDGKIRSLLGLKIHHMIGDGYSLSKLLDNILDSGTNMTQMETGGPMIPPKEWTFDLAPVKNFFLIPLTFWKLLKDFGLHKDVWTSGKSTTEVVLAMTEFEIDRFQEIRRKLKQGGKGEVPLVVVGVSCFAGALRRFLEMKSQNYQNSQSQGSNFVVALPLGKEHPGDYKFCNYWTHSILNVDISSQSPLQRLQKLHKNFKLTVDDQKWPEIYYKTVVPLQSLLPRIVWEKITDFNMGAPIGFTNMMGPPTEVSLCGRKVLGKYAYVGLLWNHSSMTCAFLSYNGKLTATLVSNKDVVQCSSEAEEIMNFFHQEMDDLLQELNKI